MKQVKLHYDLHNISLNRSGSYIYSRKWLKNKKGNNKSQKVISNAFNTL